MRRVYEKDNKGRIYYELDEKERTVADIFTSVVVLTTTFSIDMTKVNTLRREGKAPFSFYTFILKAAADTLATFPILGGRWEGKHKIICSPPGEASVGGPIQVGDTTATLWIEKANQKSLSEISEVIKKEVSEAKLGKVNKKAFLMEQEGPGLPVSNVGAIGCVEWATGPLPHFAISALGTHSIIEKPKVVDGQIQIRKLMNASLVCDRRTMNANTSIEFFTEFQRRLENPLSWY